MYVSYYTCTFLYMYVSYYIYVYMYIYHIIYMYIIFYDKKILWEVHRYKGKIKSQKGSRETWNT